MHTPLRIGLTGGIGSGKSTVGQILAEQGAVLIDADHIARSLTAPHGLAMPQIEATFGPKAVNDQGALDRDYMRQLAFNQPQARQQLEAIIHPLVGSVTQQRALQAQACGARVIVFDIPLLVESGRWRSQLDRILVVDCTTDTQIHRVIRRNGLERTAVERIIQAQASREQRRAAADWVIYNEEINLATLREQVLSISAQLPL